MDKLQFQNSIRAACLAEQMLNIHNITQDVGVSDDTAKHCLLWYYRDKNSNEIVTVIENNGQLHLLEIKRSSIPEVN